MPKQFFARQHIDGDQVGALVIDITIELTCRKDHVPLAAVPDTLEICHSIVVGAVFLKLGDVVRVVDDQAREIRCPGRGADVSCLGQNPLPHGRIGDRPKFQHHALQFQIKKSAVAVDEVAPVIRQARRRHRRPAEERGSVGRQELDQPLIFEVGFA